MECIVDMVFCCQWHCVRRLIFTIHMLNPIWGTLTRSIHIRYVTNESINLHNRFGANRFVVYYHILSCVYHWQHWINIVKRNELLAYFASNRLVASHVIHCLPVFEFRKQRTHFKKNEKLSIAYVDPYLCRAWVGMRPHFKSDFYIQNKSKCAI